MFDSIFFKGREAHEHGKKRNENPYPFGSFQYESWMAGYNSYDELDTAPQPREGILIA